jgi:galactokinase
MPRSPTELSCKASGRLCLLGEHADYLGLEVISFPLDQRLKIHGRPITGSAWRVELADLGTVRDFEPRLPVARTGRYDYVAAGLERALARGLSLRTAYEVTVRSEIPIGKGVSSSSAFCVAWTDFLHRAAEPPRALGPVELADEAYALEVLEFRQSGGMQDHYTIAFGRLVHLDCRSPIRVTRLAARMAGFVLADSGAAKDTQGVLSRVRSSVERSLARLGWPREALRTLTPDQARSARSCLDSDDAEILLATVLNRDQAREGARLLAGPLTEPDGQAQLGRLMNLHHEQLRDRLRTSTAAIDRGLEISRNSGALGGKVLGSGAGGCFLAYAPGCEEAVVQALRDHGISARAVAPLG